MNMNNKETMGQTLQGFYKVAVVNAVTDEVTWESDWNKNLILNQGMDILATTTVVSAWATALAGTGSRPNIISGGTSTITQSGATIRLLPVAGLLDFTSSVMSASHVYYSASVQVGDMIVYSSTESMVTSVDSNGINLTLNTSYSFSDERTFTIYKTSQRGLQGEVKRYNSYLTGVGNCGESSSSLVTYTNRRTYDFTSESVERTYTEVGTAWSATQTGSNVFSRILLPTPIAIGANFKLRVVYDLQISYSPSGSVYFTASIAGWPHPLGTATNTIATQSIQYIMRSVVNTSGNPVNARSSTSPLDPKSVGATFSIWISTDSQSLAPMGGAVSNRSPAVDTYCTTASYIPNSFYIDKTSTFSETEMNSAYIRSLGFGGYDGAFFPASTGQAFAVLFDQPQLKLSTQILNITFRHTWARILQ